MTKLKLRFMICITLLLIKIAEKVAFNETVQDRKLSDKLVTDLVIELEKHE